MLQSQEHCISKRPGHERVMQTSMGDISKGDQDGVEKGETWQDVKEKREGHVWSACQTVGVNTCPTGCACNTLFVKGCFFHLTGAESGQPLHLPPAKCENNPTLQVFAQLVQLGTVQGVSQPQLAVVGS